MRSYKMTCFVLVFVLAFWGCNDATGPEDGGNGENGDETTEYSLTVSADPSEGGSVEPADSTYAEGTDVTVEATPNDGWIFDSWTGDQESDENPLSFTINEDTELTANFSDTTSEDPPQYHLSVTADPSEGGSVEPMDSTSEEGSEVTVEATPNEDWAFDGWTGDRESEENPLSFTINDDTELTANFSETSSDESPEYNLSVSANPSNGGSVEPTEGTFEEGTEVTVEATPNEGWVFDGWTGDQESQENPFTFTINEDTELTANFSDTTGDQTPEYSLSVSADPSDGGSVDPSSGTFEEGTEVTVEASANQGFTFTEWTGDQQSTNNPLTFTITQNTELTANFSESQSKKYNLTVNPTEGGSVSPESGSFESGTEVTIEATPNVGWKFTGWSGDVNSSQNPLTLTVDNETELTANFSKVHYDLTVSTNPSNGGGVDPSSGSFEHGKEVTVEASANSGWEFTGWTGDKETDDNPLSFTINEDTELTANFSEVKYDLTVSADPAGGGNMEPISGTFEAGQEVTVEATADEGWKFTGWTGDQESSENPLTFTINNDTDLTANFTEVFDLTVSKNPDEGGSVDPSSGEFEAGTEVRVEAAANAHWNFDGWSGDETSSHNTLIFTITDDTEVTANFSKKEYDLIVGTLPQHGGSVEPDHGTFEYGTEITVEAIPNEGWEFTGWTEDIVSNNNPLTFTIEEFTRITANFEQPPEESIYTVEMTASDGSDDIDLRFGQQADADRSFDSGVDKYAPPAPPSDVFHVNFEINSMYLYNDFRGKSSKNEQWNLEYQVGSEDQLQLNWSITDNTETPGDLILTDTSSSFEVNMFNETSHTVSGSQSGELIIEYSYD